MRQFEVFELNFWGECPEGSYVNVDIKGIFTLNGREKEVKGFYAGQGKYTVRFCPQEPGRYQWSIQSSISLEGQLRGEETCIAAKNDRHGMVAADGLHFKYADGTRFIPFGTTVYALVHQEKTLIETTMQTLAQAPFNKLRFCVFPKSYDYNHNEPEMFAFEKTEGKWDVNRPCFAFWEALEERIRELDEMGIEGDLILFHGYDRWGFSMFSKEEACVYLDYLLRRLSSFPNLWWRTPLCPRIPRCWYFPLPEGPQMT